MMFFSFEIETEYLEFIAKLRHDLPTSATWGDRFVRLSTDDQFPKAAMPSGDGGAYCDPFGADSEAEGEVFYITARENRAVGSLDGSTDLELRVRCVGEEAGCSCGSNECVILHGSDAFTRTEAVVKADSMASAAAGSSVV